MNKKTYITILITLFAILLVEIISITIYERLNLSNAIDATDNIIKSGYYNDRESIYKLAESHRSFVHFSDAHFKVEYERNNDGYSSSSYPHIYRLSQWPWVIFQLQKDEDGDIHSFIISPTSILSKHMIESGNEIIKCLSDAYDVYCRSELKGEDISTDKRYEVMKEVENSVVDNPIYFYTKENCNDFLGHPLDIGDYRVIIDGKCEFKKALHYNYKYSEIRNNLITGSIWIYISLFVLISLLRILDWKENKDKYLNSKYYKLTKKCNPSNFLKPYQKEKVDKANELYNILRNTNPNDDVALEKLDLRIEKELNVSRIEENELQSIIKKCNPQNYMSPYNPEKVSLANDLYARLLKDDLSFNEFEEIKALSNKL